VGKTCGIFAFGGSYGTLFPHIVTNPFVALTATTILIGASFLFFDLSVKKEAFSSGNRGAFQRAWWGCLMVPVLLIANLALGTSSSPFSPYVIALSLIISQTLFLLWGVQRKSKKLVVLALGGILSPGAVLFFSHAAILPGISLFFSGICLVSLPRNGKVFEKKEPWWDVFLNHPARILFFTFLGLCIGGTLLLVLPASTRNQSISLVDAVFTSVSAVCVTGLIVLDTPHDFALFGQFAILLLIQLGGLGIMTITTVALHAMGRRLSLKQERLLTSMTDTNHESLIQSLSVILKFTFVAEGIGAMSLFGAFFLGGDPFFPALWRAIFTAISAFCNAGFALQSDSLISYNDNFYVLHVVAFLIIFGGLAPATSILIPSWLSKKKIPVHARIALVTTLILLFSGTLFILAFEWNGVLEGLSLGDKIHNAWFQSATLRTAGFNSVDTGKIAHPTFLIMILFMFIGGSPGGTAGGIKTTTLGVLALTFQANITGKNEIIMQNRRVRGSTVFRAVTILVSGMIMWFVTVLMLETTQQIPARDLIFEATSALGTVGLSTGATGFLDEIGKVVIVIAMFAGRIGPMTLFMLLKEEYPSSASSCPNAKIPLT